MAYKVAELPPRKKVIPVATLSASGYFVRDAQHFIDRIVETLAEARLLRHGRRTSDNDLKRSRNEVAKLVKQLTGPTPVLRILNVVDWYAGLPWSRRESTGKNSDRAAWRNSDLQYIPFVEVGGALLQKFDRLEGMMEQRRGGTEGRTPQEVLVDLVFPGRANQTRVEQFLQNTLPLARALRLGGAEDDGDLTEVLAHLYMKIREGRDSSNLTPDVVRRLGGPEDLLRRYLRWLHDKDWTATVKVLYFDSPSFTQFRREQARDDPRGRDPVTGKAR